MTSWSMRRISPASFARAHHASLPRTTAASTLPASTFCVNQLLQRRGLANVRDPDKGFSEVWFSSSVPALTPQSLGGNDGKPPDERTLQLGKTIRVLHDRLPTLLASPLPQDILSPQITLHLFPSTHPHLPTVSGRIAYLAALWTAPMAWGRVPVVGNVKLIILSERMIRNGSPNNGVSSRDEKLIVRWKTCGKTKGRGMGALYRGIGGSEQIDKITEFLGGEGRDDEEFCGIFVFEFDEEGRIVKHVIEHVQEGGNWGRENRFVNVTDWLLGRFNGKKKDEEVPEGGLAWCKIEGRDGRRRIRGGRREDG